MERRITFCLAALCILTNAAEASTVRIDGQNYRSLAEVASEFEMEVAPDRADEKEIGYSGEDHSLVVKLDSRQAIINGVRHWFSFPVRMNDKEGPFLSALDIDSTLVPALTPASGEKVPPVKTIVFDPGHGGHDKGGRSTLGLEKDYALDVVNRTRKILESRGIKVVQSRLSDFFVPLSQRPAMTKNYEDPIFVSVHFNAAGWRPAASGFEVFSMPPSGAPSTGADSNPKKDSESLPGDKHHSASFLLAEAVYQTLITKVPAFDRGVKRARFSVLRNAKVPAVLIEGGFLTNPEESKKIHSSEWRQKYSTALADGLCAYLEFANNGTPIPVAKDSERTPTDEFVPES